MGIYNTLKFITNHPLNSKRKVSALFTFFKWQIFSKFTSYTIVYPFAEKSKLLVKKGMSGATGNLYCGLHEFEDMSFLLHFLRPTDEFYDIGANIGSYSILAAKEIGSITYSVEPIPSTFESLEANMAINGVLNKKNCLNIGLGSESKITKFTRLHDTVNHVALENESDTIEVKVEKFDDIFQIQKISLIKIDVEGFETEVLKGMNNCLSNYNLKAIIIELNGSGLRYGYDEKKIHQLLINHEFKPYRYIPFDKLLVELDSYNNLNTIYVRDYEFVKDRIRSSRNFNIFNCSF